MGKSLIDFLLSIVVGVLLYVFLTSVVFARPTVIGDNYRPSKEDKMATAMMNPVVQVNTSRSYGSGTIVRVRKEYDGVFSYVMTNFHVISANVVKVKRDKYVINRLMPVFVTINTHARGVVTVTKLKAVIVSYSKEMDLALLRIRYSKIPAVEMVDPKTLRVFETAYVVGYPLGVPTQYPTVGQITTLKFKVGKRMYLAYNVPMIFGNSGGALFVRRGDKYLMAGVPSIMRILRSGYTKIPVTHMGMAISITEVKMFLRTSGV